MYAKNHKTIFISQKKKAEVFYRLPIIDFTDQNVFAVCFLWEGIVTKPKIYSES